MYTKSFLICIVHLMNLIKWKKVNWTGYIAQRKEILVKN
jgi:hypothetical protein